MFFSLDFLPPFILLLFVVVVQTAVVTFMFLVVVQYYIKISKNTFDFFLTDINDCVNHTCQNGGSCVDGINNFTCNCLKGYTGSYCQTGMPL